MKEYIIIILAALNSICYGQTDLSGNYQFIEWPEGETPIHNLTIRTDSTFNYKMIFCYPYFSGNGKWTATSDSIYLKFTGVPSKIIRNPNKHAPSKQKHMITISKIEPPLLEKEYIEVSSYIDGVQHIEYIDQGIVELELNEDSSNLTLSRKGYDIIDIDEILESETWVIMFSSIDYGFKRILGKWNMAINYNSELQQISIGEYKRQ